MNFKEKVAMIEKHTVYRLSAPLDDGSGMFTSTNGMPVTRWTAKQISKLAFLTKKQFE